MAVWKQTELPSRKKCLRSRCAREEQAAISWIGQAGLQCCHKKEYHGHADIPAASGQRVPQGVVWKEMG